MAEYNELYARAVYYDIVFKRDVRPDCDFIQAAFRAKTGRELTSALDIACGPGYHARELARRGVRAVGVDLRPEMIQYARDESRAEGTDVEWLVADMRAIQLDPPVDMALSMYDALDCLVTNVELVEHFQTVARNLTDQGLFLVELTHPRELPYAGYEAFEYAGERDGTSITVTWGANNPRRDPVTGIAEVDVRLHIDDHGESIDVLDHARERFLLPQEIALLAELSGVFDVVGWYGKYSLDQPLTAGDESEWVIGLLQKRG